MSSSYGELKDIENCAASGLFRRQPRLLSRSAPEPVFIEHTIKHCHPRCNQIYEIDDAWSSWLGKNYSVEVCATDGRSLKSTGSRSTDLI